MSYIFPEDETLARYLAMLSKVLIQARHRAYSTDPQLAELLDAVHNVPDLLCRWPDMEEEWAIADLERYEERYHGGSSLFSRIITEGPEEGWQLKWTEKNSNAEQVSEFKRATEQTNQPDAQQCST